MITEFNRDKPARNLPDAYDKRDGSNNAKILEIEKRATDVLKSEISDVYDCLDLDKVYGKTLDLYGDMFGQIRGIATDEQYRVLIKNRITRNLANGDFNSILNAICMTFGCSPTDITLTESEEPCRVSLEGLPISKINESNIDVNTAVQIVNSLIPAGVYLEAMNFSGTFEFSGGTDMVYDEEAGFADDGQTFGGYFGLVSDNSSMKFPI